MIIYGSCSQQSITTIIATARVLRNVITVEVGKSEWTAIPVPTWKGRIAGAISAIFSAHYRVYPAGEESGEPICSISYYPVKDDILIQVGEHKWRTQSTTFGPSKITYQGITYTLYEKITGRFSITNGETMVAAGHTHFRSVVMESYPDEMEDFFGYMAIGILIRTLFGEFAL